MVNHLRERMPRPIVGVAHSFGAAQLYNPEVHFALAEPWLTPNQIPPLVDASSPLP